MLPETTKMPKKSPKKSQRDQKQTLNCGWFLILRARMGLPSACWNYGAKRRSGSILSFLFGVGIFEQETLN